ncbi:hypothetical protein Tco_0749538 [Tanacetum coccineum]|uniref:Reverse transcriptase domain-containing protein n=1 Tax=Tanacetum coccineum TaxID=301880 RepID=A0ABQ4YZG8_9ASTR
MDDEPMWASDHVVAPTPSSAITIPEIANKFTIKCNHLTLVKGNQFDGRTKTDPQKHIHEFLRICDMFKYRDTKNEVVSLMMFPLSLTGEAKTWLNELNKGTIETCDELRTAFISRFFRPALFNRLLGEIRAFLKKTQENESLSNALLKLRMKESTEPVHAGVIFLYKTPNQAYQLLEDKVLLKFDWAKNQKTKTSPKKTIAFADEGSSNTYTDKIMARMDAMTLRMDAQYKELQSHAKQPTPDLDDDDMPMSHKEEAKFMQTFPPTDLELKPLPDNLEYVFLEEPSFLLVIISSQLSAQNKSKLVSVLKKHKEAFSWKTTDIPGICPSFCKHNIQLLDDNKPIVQKQRRLNPNMQEVVKKEIVKLLDTGIIYPIADSPWVSPIHCVPKKGGITVVTNKNDELVPTRTVTGWRV